MTHKIREVYIVHHSHTDVGYTDLQEQLMPTRPCISSTAARA